MVFRFDFPSKYQIFFRISHEKLLESFDQLCMQEAASPSLCGGYRCAGKGVMLKGLPIPVSHMPTGGLQATSLDM